jgi:hypothetical protein
MLFNAVMSVWFSAVNVRLLPKPIYKAVSHDAAINALDELEKKMGR